MEPLKMAASLRVRRCRRLVVAGEYSEAAAGRDDAAVRVSPCSFPAPGRIGVLVSQDT